MRGARTPAAPARPSPPGSTPPPASARARTPSSGWTPGRCTSSTRPAAATYRWAVTTAAGRSRCSRSRIGPTQAGPTQARPTQARPAQAGPTRASRRLLPRTPPVLAPLGQAPLKRLPARRGRPGRLPDRAPQALDDLVVPFVGPDEPVPLGGDPHVGLGLGAGADHVGGPEHPDHGPVFLGEPPAGDLAAVHEPVLVLHAPASPGLDGLAQLG